MSTVGMLGASDRQAGHRSPKRPRAEGSQPPNGQGLYLGRGPNASYGRSKVQREKMNCFLPKCVLNMLSRSFHRKKILLMGSASPPPFFFCFTQVLLKHYFFFINTVNLYLLTVPETWNQEGKPGVAGRQPSPAWRWRTQALR